MDSYRYHTQRLTVLQRAPLSFFYDVGLEQCYSPKDTYHTRAEFALRCAVLEDAFDCFGKQFVTNAREALRLAREAERWFFSNDPHWPFSFVNICTALGLNPEDIRRKLRRWRQDPSHAPWRRRRSIDPVRRRLETAA